MLSRSINKIMPILSNVFKTKQFSLLPKNKLILKSYHEKVIDHYEKPRNVGSLDKNDKKVGTGLVGAPACGDVMKLQIKVTDDGVIENAVFKVCRVIKQRPLDVALQSPPLPMQLSC
jgi:hypothetical protein